MPENPVCFNSLKNALNFSVNEGIFTSLRLFQKLFIFVFPTSASHLIRDINVLKLKISSPSIPSDIPRKPPATVPPIPINFKKVTIKSCIPVPITFNPSLKLLQTITNLFQPPNKNVDA